jgi:hypothetical protein
MRVLVSAALILMAMALRAETACAQSWQAYSYADAGFAVQLPAAPTVTKGSFKTNTGVTVPAATYSLRQPDALYTLTVADFSQAGVDQQALVDEAVKSFESAGEIKVNVAERIDRHFGRQLSVAGKDGSRSAVAIFFVNRKLYELEGRALPPRPEAGSANTIRFEQSLEFIGLGDQDARPENRGRGGGGPGPGGRPLPPQAFADCEGHQAGDAVKHTAPFGVVDATCVQLPDGRLAARPVRLPPGNPPSGSPPSGGPPPAGPPPDRAP